MEPSNLSINSTQQSASQFFQKSVASLQSWGSRVCQQLHHHREILHTYSPKTKIGLLIIVNALFFVITRAIVNHWEARANHKYPEKTLLNDKIATALVGVVTAGVNVGLSKLGRYQLPALTLYAITISSMVVYQILKRPQPLLVPLLTEIRDELRLIDQAQAVIETKLTELGSAHPTSTFSTPSTPTSPSTSSTPSTPASPSIPPTPASSGAATTQTEEVQKQITELTQTRQGLADLKNTLQQEEQVVAATQQRLPSTVVNDPQSPVKVMQTVSSMRSRLNNTLPQSPLAQVPSRVQYPQPFSGSGSTATTAPTSPAAASPAPTAGTEQQFQSRVSIDSSSPHESIFNLGGSDRFSPMGDTSPLGFLSNPNAFQSYLSPSVNPYEFNSSFGHGSRVME